MKPPRFTREEETALHARMIQGDMEAKDLLARSVLRWAFRCAVRFGGNAIDGEELEGLAGLGVVDALRRWQPDRGRLTSAVIWSVRSVVNVHVHYMLSPVKIPANAREADQTRELAEKASERVYSLSEIYPGTNSSRGDQLESESAENRTASEYESELQTMREQFQLAIRKMNNDRHIVILLGRAEGKTLEQLGNELEITRERVRQIETQAIRSIQKILKIAV